MFTSNPRDLKAKILWERLECLNWCLAIWLLTWSERPGGEPQAQSLWPPLWSTGWPLTHSAVTLTKHTPQTPLKLQYSTVAPGRTKSCTSKNKRRGAISNNAHPALTGSNWFCHSKKITISSSIVGLNGLFLPYLVNLLHPHTHTQLHIPVTHWQPPQRTSHYCPTVRRAKANTGFICMRANNL